ncbi:MAG TPA: hypothetical protein VEX14_02260, partial [Burkholderiaceae bacterium]|nr:hypothetical protein [Burkholderiaceae bacterium]
VANGCSVTAAFDPPALVEDDAFAVDAIDRVDRLARFDAASTSRPSSEVWVGGFSSRRHFADR